MGHLVTDGLPVATHPRGPHLGALLWCRFGRIYTGPVKGQRGSYEIPDSLLAQPSLACNMGKRVCYSVARGPYEALWDAKMDSAGYIPGAIKHQASNINHQWVPYVLDL